ncbi:MAG: hypothetical protein JWQ89_2812 [Devosia sp.]|uniref:hypothetical protein n=1 Tax=Devosia sp. TaxID=1871048 RepID=UPI00262C0EE2|nr:hypothetical protein [Devosia sp.]MDB5541085.1 hypothetical protein [Devosia sp.]
MRHLLPILTIGLAIAAASPVAAQPVNIIVRGGAPEFLPVPLPNDYHFGDHIFGRYFFDNLNFDPASAANNAENAIRYRPRTVDVNLLVSMARTPGSWAVHQEQCQARYPSYDWASDTILVGRELRFCPL